MKHEFCPYIFENRRISNFKKMRLLAAELFQWTGIHDETNSLFLLILLTRLKSHSKFDVLWNGGLLVRDALYGGRNLQTLRSNLMSLLKYKEYFY